MTFLLLDSGANINAADQRLATPLHYAAYGTHTPNPKPSNRNSKPQTLNPKPPEHVVKITPRP